MKKKLKIVLLVLFVIFLAAQFFRPDRTTAPIVQAETLEATVAVPENVAVVLKRSCNDCHTNETRYPWYSEVVPASWLLADHINEGRQKLNFSVWNTYDNTKKRRKMDQICDQITDGEMPQYQYLWIHRDAHLTDEDKKVLCDWTEAERAKIPVVN
jgi:Haem-binding domain